MYGCLICRGYILARRLSMITPQAKADYAFIGTRDEVTRWCDDSGVELLFAE